MFPGDAFLEVGWRIPFFISIILVLVGYLVRRSVDESPVFQEIKETAQEQSAPIVQVFKKYGLVVLFAALVWPTGIVLLARTLGVRSTPGLLAALTPVVVGFGLGIGALAGFLAGAIGTVLTPCSVRCSC